MATGQAERLMPLLEEVLALAGAGWRDLAALGVGTGPGNFTGIRIAVAAARGLALSLRVPAIGVTGFEALVWGLPGPVLALIDARQGRLWAQAGDAAPELLEAGAPLPARWSGLPVAGHRAAEVAAALGSPVLAPAAPLAEAIARVAAMRRGRNLPRPAPLYLRAADALPPSDPPPVILP